MHTVTKSYRDLPAAHRQPKHDGHCRLIHGHNWGFDITLSCQVLDANGFVLDVGKMKTVKDFLTGHFDHTLLLNEDDPLVQYDEEEGSVGFFSTLEKLANVIVLPNCGMEGLAKFVYDELTDRILPLNFPQCVQQRGLRVVSVTCFEDSKNTSTYLL